VRIRSGWEKILNMLLLERDPVLASLRQIGVRSVPVGPRRATGRIRSGSRRVNARCSI
jgi:hypothetical protein